MLEVVLTQNGWAPMKDFGKGLFLVKKCENRKVNRVHGDHLKVYVICEQVKSSLTRKASPKHQASSLLVKQNHHTVTKDSSTHECIFSVEERDDVIQNRKISSQDCAPLNAIDKATLKDLQVYCDCGVWSLHAKI